MTELSIIIPVYNAEKYLENCLETILTCKKKNLEVVLINDGSTDHTEEICLKWSQKDSRVQVRTIKNSGVSIARNTGIETASGNYMMFLDADDFLCEEWWKPVWHYMGKGIEFVAFSYYTYYSDGQKYEERFKGEKEISDAKMIDEILLATPLLHTCWGKLFQTSLIREKQISFPSDYTIGEDYYFVLQYLRDIQNKLLINYPLVFYRQNESGAMRTFHYEKRVPNMQSLRTLCYQYAAELKKESLYPAMNKYYFRSLTNLLRDIAVASPDRKSAAQIYERLFQEDVYNDIIKVTQIWRVPVYKLHEYLLMYLKMKNLLAVYFIGKGSMKKHSPKKEDLK